jgi:hypothetical protein
MNKNNNKVSWSLVGCDLVLNWFLSVMAKRQQLQVLKTENREIFCDYYECLTHDTVVGFFA